MADKIPENTQDEVKAFFEQEIARHEKATRKTWLGGLLSAALVAAYMAGLLAFVRSVLDPPMAAAMLANELEESLPSVVYETEAALEAQAPVLANAFSAKLSEGMTLARKEAEQQIDFSYQVMLPAIGEEFSIAIHEYVEAHAGDIEEFYRTQTGEGFAESFVQALVDDVMADIDREMAAQCGGRGMEQVRAQSLDVMQQIHDALVALRGKDTAKMTRSERLQRRLIVHWIRVLEELQRRQIEGNPGEMSVSG